MANNINQCSDSDKLSALLRLKRHEQPKPEFWHKFEREFEEKRLQALVKPSWSSLFGKVWGEHRAWVVPATAAPVLLAMVSYLFFFTPLDDSHTQALAGVSSPEEQPQQTLENMVLEDPLTGEPLNFVFGEFSPGEFSPEVTQQGPISFVADNLAKNLPNAQARGFRTELTQDVLEKDPSVARHQVALVSYSRDTSAASSAPTGGQMSF
ncbi:MAG: hypothetical protein JJT75_12100 [Opitutales bacterium]|nr:hypothetical protein [Opitutales bacterium]MCH8540224.1 hypothetical protein [Opitutales bacterium]